MKLVIQRVEKATVSVRNEWFSEIGKGLFVLVGIGEGDSEEIIDKMSDKLSKMRLMSDMHGKMNLSLKDARADIMVVSQFTLYADTSAGNRPSFIKAARPEVAKPLYDRFVHNLINAGHNVRTGSFGEYMEITTVCDGPVTIVVEG